MVVTPYYEDDLVTLYHGDCLDVLAEFPDGSVDAVVTDPPYGLEFMGKEWDAPWKDERTDKRGVIDPAEWGGQEDAPGKGNPYSRSRIRTAAAHYGGDAAAVGRQFQAWCEQWTAECLRVLKPGGHLLAFGGTRTWHRLACAIEDAGFEVRDSIAWLYGSGFPKSLDVSKAIDKAARGVPQGGADPTSPNHGRYRTTSTEGKRWEGDSGQSYGAGGSRFLADGVGPASDSVTGPAASGAAAIAPEAERWQGWGTALKPAFEPIVMGRKPLAGTVAANVLAHGTGALNIDGCRIEGELWKAHDATGLGSVKFFSEGDTPVIHKEPHDGGRWPANVVLDESQAEALDQQSGELTSGVLAAHHQRAPKESGILGAYGSAEGERGFGDSGGASRFFYVAKADSSERVRINGIAHPTVKPLDLMRWLVRLVTPPGGTVLEPFAGSGATVEACILEGFRCIAVEREADYLPLISQRISRRLDPVAAVRAAETDGGLFDLLDQEGEAS